MSPWVKTSITGTPAAGVISRGSPATRSLLHWFSGTCQGGLPLYMKPS